MYRWQNTVVAKLISGKIKSGQMYRWRNKIVAKCRGGQMQGWPNVKVAKCRGGEMAVAKCRVAKFQWGIVGNPMQSSSGNTIELNHS